MAVWYYNGLTPVTVGSRVVHAKSKFTASRAEVMNLLISGKVSLMSEEDVIVAEKPKDEPVEQKSPVVDAPVADDTVTHEEKPVSEETVLSREQVDLDLPSVVESDAGTGDGVVSSPSEVAVKKSKRRQRGRRNTK